MNLRGFVMTEVLAALLVLAVAVTAALALALRGFAATAEARRAETAAGLAADLAGRMRALPAVDWTALPAPVDCGAECSPGQLAALELAEWEATVADALPAGMGQLETAGAGQLVAVLCWTETGGVPRELRLGIGR
jgi:prepilin-type N-terminal cleavage/methylation domain-containing protein